MDSERIDALIEKYWKCETTLEEEHELQTFFKETPASDQLKETAALFKYLADQKSKDLTDVSFEKEVIRRIKQPAKGRRASLVYNTMRIAAGILVLIAAIWLVRIEVRKSAPAEIADTYDDPKMAFEETKRALMMISKSFSAAEEQAKKINLFNEAQQEIKKEETGPAL